MRVPLQWYRLAYGRWSMTISMYLYLFLSLYTSIMYILH